MKDDCRSTLALIYASHNRNFSVNSDPSHVIQFVTKPCAVVARAYFAISKHARATTAQGCKTVNFTALAVLRSHSPKSLYETALVVLALLHCCQVYLLLNAH